VRRGPYRCWKPRSRLGWLIWGHRLRRGWTQAELAEMIGVSQSTVGDWERGAQTPSRQRLRALAKALRITQQELRQAMAIDRAQALREAEQCPAQ
jgi:transcriptional regulator with XRE-family HTH domain